MHMMLMGIHGLTKSIKSMSANGITQKTYEDLAPDQTILGVDVYSYLYPSQYNAGAKGKGCHIRNFMDMISNFYAANIRLVFVFDGKTYSEDKKATIDARMEKRNDTQMEMLQMLQRISTGHEQPLPKIQEVPVEGAIMIPVDSAMLKSIGDQMIRDGHGTEEERETLRKIMKRNITITTQDVQDLVTLFDMVGAPYFQAKGEADFLLATMYEDKLISGVLSEDKDMLTHGVGRLISGLIDANCRKAGIVMEYNLDTILEESKLSMAQFIDFCILSGCDYGAKISGVAAGKGLQYIKKYGNISGIIEAMRNNKISYRPDDNLTLEEYQTKYNRVFSIFNERQESADRALNTQFTYYINPDLKRWLMSNTNYTAGTLDKKIVQLSTAPSIAPSIAPLIVPRVTPKISGAVLKAKLIPKVKNTHQEVADTTLSSVNVTAPKIKITIKQKHHT